MRPCGSEWYNPKVPCGAHKYLLRPWRRRKQAKNVRSARVSWKTAKSGGCRDLADGLEAGGSCAATHGQRVGSRAATSARTWIGHRTVLRVLSTLLFCYGVRGGCFDFFRLVFCDVRFCVFVFFVFFVFLEVCACFGFLGFEDFFLGTTGTASGKFSSPDVYVARTAALARGRRVLRLGATT